MDRPKTLKRVIRERQLTPEEAAKYNKIEAQAAQELPELIARHHDRMESKENRMDRTKMLNDLKNVCKQIGNNGQHAKAWNDSDEPEAERTALLAVQRDLKEAQELLNQLLG